MEITFKCIKCGEISSDKYALTCKNHSQYYSYYEVHNGPKFTNILNEGNTPLLQLHKYSNHKQRIFAKCEYVNPSGSVKDREVSAIFQFVKSENIRSTYMVSGGSGARAATYFANRLNIPCKTISSNDYEASFKEAIDTKLFYNVTPGINPLAAEGTKMIAHELRQQLENIDVIIVPMGNGTMIAGIWRGIKEFFPDKFPKLIGVEMLGADPIYQAMIQNQDFFELDHAPTTAAKALCAKAAFSSPLAIRAIKESNGTIIRISEDELLEEVEIVKTRKEITPCVSSISVLAALKKYSEDGDIACILSG